ncbi:MAG: cysteate synthase [Methanotrichaceae archaeon]|nr:cysteate synthase [Methanotrichaceae archaeon]
MGDHVVRCVYCDEVQSHYALSCPKDNALVRAYYSARQLKPKSLHGMWTFLDWLPVNGIIKDVGEAAITYRSENLAAELGLDNLFISFSGYWPERNALMKTCSFKDLEAPPTIQRLIEQEDRSKLVVASAGNTARSFAQVASVANYPLILFVPEMAMKRMWLTVEKGPVKLLGVKGDYTDAINVAENVAVKPGFVAEGGAKNIARRDGMGTVMLDASLTIGHIPQHYFQAIGSGAGGISAWEAALRLKNDGRFGLNLPRLHLAQSFPNSPIFYSWNNMEPRYTKAEETYDDVLFNRKPPYEIKGGVKDALINTDGQVYGISNNEAENAKKVFEQSEEIDIINAPAVAVAALIKAVESRTIGTNDITLLNITGGGVARLKEDFDMNMLQPDASISSAQEALEFLEDTRLRR